MAAQPAQLSDEELSAARLEIDDPLALPNLSTERPPADLPPEIAPMRNMIAHSHCAGFWTKHPDYVVFLTFQKVGEDALAVDGLNIHGMQRATAWAKAMRKLAFEISNVPYGDAN